MKTTQKPKAPLVPHALSVDAGEADLPDPDDADAVVIFTSCVRNKWGISEFNLPDDALQLLATHIVRNKMSFTLESVLSALKKLRCNKHHYYALFDRLLCQENALDDSSSQKLQ